MTPAGSRCPEVSEWDGGDLRGGTAVAQREFGMSQPSQSQAALIFGGHETSPAAISWRKTEGVSTSFVPEANPER
jgi:hypothetical protein